MARPNTPNTAQAWGPQSKKLNCMARTAASMVSGSASAWGGAMKWEMGSATP